MDADLLAFRALMRELEPHWNALQEESERIAAERHCYLDFFDRADEAYLVTRSWCIVAEANQAAGRLLGSAPGRLVGKPLAVLVGLPQRHEFRGRVAALKAGTPWPHGWKLRIGREGHEGTDAVLSVRSMGSGLCWALREAA
jgi:PAS domain-containing protein